MERSEDLELSKRMDELVPIYESLQTDAIATELIRCQNRQLEQIARQMAMAEVLGKRAINGTE